MYKEHKLGAAPPALEELATKIKAADAFVFVTGEYNWGMQPGLKNLTDHFLEEMVLAAGGHVSYSAGRIAGARSKFTVAWHLVGDGHARRVEHADVVDPSWEALSTDGKPTGEARNSLEKSFVRFADDLAWWTEAAKMQRARKAPPY